MTNFSPPAPGHAALQSLPQPHQVGLVVGRLPEGAEHHGGSLHRGQPLALHIPHDHPDPVRRGDHLVQVAADTGLRDGRGVRHRRLQRARGPRYRPQQHPLGHLRDRPHAGQLRLPAGAHHGGRNARAGDAGDRHHRGEAPAFLEQPVVQPEPHAQHQGHRTYQRRTPPPADQPGERRPQRDQRQETHPRPGDDIRHGHHGHRSHRHPGQHRKTRRRLLHGHASSSDVSVRGSRPITSGTDTPPRL